MTLGKINKNKQNFEKVVMTFEKIWCTNDRNDGKTAELSKEMASV